MPRPAATDSAETRRKLLGAASEAFSRQGPEATSLRDVARAAGLTIASVHFHFGSKDGLHRACLEEARRGLGSEFAPFREVLESIQQKARGAAKSRAEIPALIDASVRAALHALRQQRKALRLLMHGLIDGGELEPAWLHGTLAPFLAETAAVLSEPLAIPERDLRLRIQSLVALVVRHALSSPGELRAVAGAKASANVSAIYEDHLIWLARRILLEK